MTQELHRLIDNGAPQTVINERIAGLIENNNKELIRVETLIEKITGDHEKRLRWLERTTNYTLGAGAIIYIAWQLVSKVIK